MQFLLAAVNAKYIHSNPAVYSLRAYAGEELRQYIQLAEYTINQQMQDILADIYKRRPNVVGFSCYIWNFGMVKELIVELKKVLPGTDIWLGGPEVSYDAPKVLAEFPQLTGIMVGEGEETFRELLLSYVNGIGDREAFPASIRRIAGLCLPSGYTAPRPLTDLGAIPFLYEYEDNLEAFANRIIYYESSRGCPYRCSYCLSSIDKKVRLRDMEIVRKELQFFLDHKVKQVKFVDRTFNCDHEHAMGIWRYIHEHDNGVTNFHFEISADILREDELDLLRRFRPGLAQLEIGVQSVNPDTIRAINRVMNVDRLESIVSSIRAGGNIHQHLDLIAGLPYENYDSFVNSFNRVYAMRPDQLQLGFLKVLKGSPMERQAQEYGIIYMSRPPYEVLYTKWISYEEVLRLKRIEEMVELYYNSGQFTATLPFLERVFPHPFALYEALADYYTEKEYFTESPARAYRYRILLEFAVKYDGEREDCYRELLTYDMYLRENLKSRPEFACGMRELEEVKDFIREFYRTEERERRFLPGYETYDWKQMSKMTHLEPFTYPVWDEDLMRGARGKNAEEREAKQAYVLFDYRKRNPLDGQAHIQIVYTDHQKEATGAGGV